MKLVSNNGNNKALIRKNEIFKTSQGMGLEMTKYKESQKYIQ
jgi:hypothetical protein